MRPTSTILTLVLIATALGRSVAASFDDDPKLPAPDDVPIPIFLNAPTDLDAFWKRLDRPDFVLLDGELYRKLRQSSDPSGVKPVGSTEVVESVAVTGEASGDWARLAVEFRVMTTTDGPRWVGLQLDGLTLSDAREGTAVLPTRRLDDRGWQVELKGRGDHLVRVSLLAPIKSTVEGRRIEIAIPAAASTRIDLTMPRTILEPRTGPNEPVGFGPVEEGSSVRISSRVGPRSKLELTWREPADLSIKLPTLLSAQGEFSLEVERASIRSRSTWIVGSIRGVASSLTVRLDPAEELLDVDLDGKPVQVETRREGGRSVLSIPLAEPLRPGSTRTIHFETNRPIPPNGTARVTLMGASFDQARVQTGVIAIAKTGPIFVNSSGGRGLRRIDPRTQLPESLRSRQETTLAFEFDDQPFELSINVDPAPPRLRAESRTTIWVDPRSARVRSRLDCRASQGKVFEVRVILPVGLQFEGAEPVESVESARVVPVDDGSSVATITLTPQARESDAFSITLNGSCPIDPSKPVALPLFRPSVDSLSTSRFAVVSDRNVSVELAPTDGAPSPFELDWGSPPADWAWPGRRPGPEMGLIWLRADSSPDRLPLKVAVRPRSIRLDSILTASVAAQEIEVVDEIVGEVAFGSVSRLDIALPAEVPARWEVEGVELAGREPLGTDSTGHRRYRLRFARDYADAFRIRVRYRIPIPAPPEGGGSVKIRIAPIRALEGTSTGRKVVLVSDSSGDIKAEAKGWLESSVFDEARSPESTPRVRLAFSTADERPGPVEVSISSVPRPTLPGVVVSRLWIRTTQRPDEGLATSARFWVEGRDGSMRVGLPPGSRWGRAKVGESTLSGGDVEILGPDDYRVRFPTSSRPDPVLVTIDFEIPTASTSTSSGWPTLRILDGGIILKTAWEVQILAARAGVGTPSGWTDENEWFWAGMLWKRRPRENPLGLFRWLAGGNARFGLDEPLDSGLMAGHQTYLFSRVGPPSALQFPIFSRLTLLLACSGPILAVGLGVLARRPMPQALAASVLIGGFAVGALVDPDVVLLIMQSSILGVVLLLLALAMNWVINRSGRPRAPEEGSLIAVPPPASSMMARSAPASSEDSTAIRARPIGPSSMSTADHIVLIRPATRPTDDPSSDPGRS